MRRGCVVRGAWERKDKQTEAKGWCQTKGQRRRASAATDWVRTARSRATTTTLCSASSAAAASTTFVGAAAVSSGASVSPHGRSASLGRRTVSATLWQYA